MSTSYPAGIDSAFPTSISDTTATQAVHAQWHNDHNLAIIAIETELGTNPRGTYTNVAAALADKVKLTPGNGSQVIKPSLDERAMVLRPFSDTQTNKILEFQNAAGSTVIASIDKTGNADFASYKVGGTALASTHLSDSSGLARVGSSNTFSVGQTISAAAGLTLSGTASKSLLNISSTAANAGLTIGGDVTIYRSSANVVATDDTLLFPQAVGTTVILQTTVASVLTSQLKASGVLEWANGSGAVDTNWYRRGASLVGTDYTVDVNLEVVARSGATAQTKIGALGPSSEAALQLGSATQFTLYKSGSNAATTTGALTVGSLTTTGAVDAASLKISGTALASTHLSDTAQLARLASPTFTGTPAAPTAAVDTNTTQIATTAYVIGQGYLKSATAASTYAPLASPSLTGTPTAPTAAANSNNTQVATTAYVDAAIVNGVPAGTTVPYSGYTAPSGWSFADGTTLSRTTNATLFNAITFTQSVTTTNGSTAVTVTDSSNMIPGCPVEGTGIPVGATVASVVDATHITISANATASGSVTARFFPHGNGDGSTTFTKPDIRGRTVHGRGTHADMAYVGKTEGQSVNSRTAKHGHGAGSLAASGGGHGHAHTLTLPNHGHSFSGSTGTDGAHVHNLRFQTGGDNSSYPYPGGTDYNSGDGATGFPPGHQSDGAHSHSVSGTVGNPTSNPAIVGSVGGADGTHGHTFSGTIGTTTNAPLESAAFIVLNYIIKH